MNWRGMRSCNGLTWELEWVERAMSVTRGQARLPVFKGRGGLLAGVNPLSNKALLESLGDDA